MMIHRYYYYQFYIICYSIPISITLSISDMNVEYFFLMQFLSLPLDDDDIQQSFVSILSKCEFLLLNYDQFNVDSARIKI